MSSERLIHELIEARAELVHLRGFGIKTPWHLISLDDQEQCRSVARRRLEPLLLKISRQFNPVTA